ncbi:hypothetical protein, partial [Rhizobium johnstonii]|uniref:hypothetical protein n=1 Tax=Rhizobium johnstonii TaxID=3019933 RepID=UPI003F94A455
VAGKNTTRFAIDSAGMVIAGAFILVPTFTALQTWANEDCRARVIGAAKGLAALFITVRLGLVAAGQALGASMPQILIGRGIINLA